MNGLNGMARGGGGFNAMAAGRKQYGTGRSAPTSGAVDKQGYAERDRRLAARNRALLGVANEPGQATLAKRIGAI